MIRRLAKLAARALWFAGLGILPGSCGDFVPPEEIQINIDLKDPEVRRLFDWQEQQATASLLDYFQHPKATFRYLSAEAFASIRKPEYLTRLTALLDDPVDSVRMAAAYAIGQLGDSSAAPALAAAFDSSATFPHANAAILEAVGKCAPPAYLEHLATVRNYTPDLPGQAEGLAWGIYRFGLRGITSAEARKKMWELLSETAFEPRIRLIAAHYLARSAQDMEEIDVGALAGLFRKEQNEEIRMALALALGKTKAAEALEAFSDQWGSESTARVKTQMMRALVFFEQPEAIPLAVNGLNDPDPDVSQQAALYFVEQGRAGAAYQYWRWSRDSFPLPTRLALSRATMKFIPLQADTNRRAYSYLMRREFLNETDPYRKAGWLTAVSEDVWNFRFIFRESFAHPHPAVRTAGLRALREICSRPDFDRIFGLGRERVRQEMADFFLQALKTDDAGQIAEAAQALRIPERDFSGLLADSLPRLESILAGLSLPEQLEPVLELQKTIRYFKGLPALAEPPPGHYQETDWNRILIDIPERAVIETDRGAISLTFFPEQAPASVVNFVNLAEQDFFDGKVFHRVVPNFVIQGGCPRGDGYGVLDYLIRSELAYLHYAEGGMLGMASAGPHTESTQFFITHAATPHLDGQYTLFGRVTEGMDVVRSIRVGDRIRDIIID